jgi:hypothetical protein
MRRSGSAWCRQCTARRERGYRPGQLATDRCEYAEEKRQPGGEPDMGGGSFGIRLPGDRRSCGDDAAAIADQAGALEHPSALPVGRPSHLAHFSE